MSIYLISSTPSSSPVLHGFNVDQVAPKMLIHLNMKGMTGTLNIETEIYIALAQQAIQRPINLF